MKQFIDKLIERLEEIEVENSCYGCTYRTQCDAVQEKVSDETDLCGATIKEVAIEIVNQLAEEHKDDIQTIDVSELLGESVNDGWIPCSSGVIPKANGWYLVTNELGVVQQQYWSASHWQKLRDEAVVAWRELPAPYQPKG